MYKQKKIAYNKYKRKVKEEKMKVIDKIAIYALVGISGLWGIKLLFDD